MDTLETLLGAIVPLAADITAHLAHIRETNPEVGKEAEVSMDALHEKILSLCQQIEKTTRVLTAIDAPAAEDNQQLLAKIKGIARTLLDDFEQISDEKIL
jgi:hypothetical protein